MKLTTGFVTKDVSVDELRKLQVRVLSGNLETSDRELLDALISKVILSDNTAALRNTRKEANHMPAPKQDRLGGSSPRTCSAWAIYDGKTVVERTATGQLAVFFVREDAETSLLEISQGYYNKKAKLEIRPVEIIEQNTTALATMKEEQINKCELCDGTGTLTFNPNLNPNAFPGSTSKPCPACDGWGHTKIEIQKQQGHVTESIFDGTLIVPLADVQHIEKRGEGRIVVIMKSTRYSFECDEWDNAVHFAEDEAKQFIAAWCRYRSELELATLADLSKLKDHE